MNAQSIIAIVLLTFAATPAVAGVPTVPEPGILELLAISAVAGITIAIRNRRR
jgi:hypothetical protein